MTSDGLCSAAAIAKARGINGRSHTRAVGSGTRGVGRAAQVIFKIKRLLLDAAYLSGEFHGGSVGQRSLHRCKRQEMETGMTGSYAA